MPTAEESEVITLGLTPGIRVTGEDVQGEVSLNFVRLRSTPIEEVHVKLRGSVFTQITRQQGDSTLTRRQRIELLRSTVSVWKRGSAYPPPGTDILRIPFRFNLIPSQTLPSCLFTSYRRSGRIVYSVEVVGVRSGLHFNKRLSNALSVVPPDAAGAAISQKLRSGEVPSWRSIRFNKHVRRGIWGEYSNVEATLTLPSINVFPIFTPIPFVLTIITTSKRMKKDETPENQPIFPSPPLTPKGVEFTLTRAVMVRTHSWSENGRDTVAAIGGLSPESSDPHFYDEVQIEGVEKTWIPSYGDEKKNKGSWRQEVNFKSTFKLNCPPAFQSPTMGIQYILNLKIDFPGIGNDLKTEIPIVVVSSMLPPGAGAWDGPPQELDLPPAYFSTADVNHDEKDSE
ncbi:hypothetical protein NM688_g1165 [Phlebia brevispora]|uniref:Uncharacterized protein n=1 Tax=Phlebia brevispora TaxID=194682 RepID=A0ACC1TCA5_9APHY|nr:hypothetical protein NM688_g1165 [Phlebia brevispora]